MCEGLCYKEKLYIVDMWGDAFILYLNFYLEFEKSRRLEYEHLSNGRREHENELKVF